MAVLTAAIIISCGGNAPQQQNETKTEAVENAEPLEGPQRYTSVEIVEAYTQICANTILELKYVETAEDFENVMDAYTDEHTFFNITYGDSLSAALKDPAAVNEAKEFLRVSKEFTALVAAKASQFKPGASAATELEGTVE